MVSHKIKRISYSLKLFHYTHFLNLVIYVLLIIHAKVFWKWLMVPAIILAIEYCVRLVWSLSESRGTTYIKGKSQFSISTICIIYCFQKLTASIDVNILPSRVTHLVLSRPRNFKFKAGDYIFLNIPALSSFEWHPFTISSSPALKGLAWKLRSRCHHIFVYSF